MVNFSQEDTGQEASPLDERVCWETNSVTNWKASFPICDGNLGRSLWGDKNKNKIQEEKIDSVFVFVQNRPLWETKTKTK